MTTAGTSRPKPKRRSTRKPPRNSASTATPQTGDKKKIALLTRKLTATSRELSEARQQQATTSRELSESLEREAASSQILGIISSSPADLEPVFKAILANATRLCEASFGTLWLCEADGIRAVALHGAVSDAYAAERRRQAVFRPTGGSLGRAIQQPPDGSDR